MASLDELNRFIARHGVDPLAGEALLCEDPEVQRYVIESGDFGEGEDASAGVMRRIQSASKLFSGEGSPSVDDFITSNGLEGKAAAVLRGEPPDIQASVIEQEQKVLLRNARDPQAALMGRIKRIREDMGRASVRQCTFFVEGKCARGAQCSFSHNVDNAENGWCHASKDARASDRPNGHSTAVRKSMTELDVSHFLSENLIDVKAGDSLLAESPEVQRQVVEQGPLINCQNPSAALMKRIKDAKVNAWTQDAPRQTSLRLPPHLIQGSARQDSWQGSSNSWQGSSKQDATGDRSAVDYGPRPSEEGVVTSMKAAPLQRRIFISGLPDTCTKQSLMSHFSEISDVDDALVTQDKGQTCAFVSFTEEEGVDTVMELRDSDGILFENTIVEVKRCLPKRKGGSKPAADVPKKMTAAEAAEAFLASSSTPRSTSHSDWEQDTSWWQPPAKRWRGDGAW